MLPINVGDNVNVRFHPGAVPTTATVTAIDKPRGLITVNHMSGALNTRVGVVHADHCKHVNDPQQLPFCDSKLWQ